MLDLKIEALKKMIAEYVKQDVCVAFSGGVDSAALLYMVCEQAQITKKKVYAVTLDTVLHPTKDLEIAKNVLSQTSAIHKIISMNELALPELQYNPLNRCYLCKKEMFRHMVQWGMNQGVSVFLEGTNADDLKTYRPGIAALKELGIKSPFADAEIGKQQVRELAKLYGISVANRPSTPCMATRLPYGDKIDLQLLHRIEICEEHIRNMGFHNVRVRVHKDILRLEIDISQWDLLAKNREKLMEHLKAVECNYITIDFEGFRSGSMDLHER